MNSFEFLSAAAIVFWVVYTIFATVLLLVAMKVNMKIGEENYRLKNTVNKKQ